MFWGSPVSPLPYHFPSHDSQGFGQCFVWLGCVPDAVENSCPATTLEEPIWEQHCRKGVQSLPKYLIFGGRRGYKTSYVHKGKMGEWEKISVFSKRKLFFFLFFLYPFAWTVQLSFAAGRWHCYTGKHFLVLARPKSMVYFPCAVLRSFPSLEPGDQVGNAVFPQSCTALPN